MWERIGRAQGYGRIRQLKDAKNELYGKNSSLVYDVKYARDHFKGEIVAASANIGETSLVPVLDNATGKIILLRDYEKLSNVSPVS